MARHAEKLVVTNFAGLKYAEILVERLTILIGPQASGKSVCAKLLFFAKQIAVRLTTLVEQGLSRPEIDDEYKKRFLNYFPSQTWGSNPFEIEYTYGALSLKISGVQTGSKLEIEFSDYFDDLIRQTEEARVQRKTIMHALDLDAVEIESYAGPHKIVTIQDKLRKDSLPTLANRSFYIPAGRSFYSFFGQNIFSLTTAGIDLDPFLLEFGTLYERLRKSYSSDQNEIRVARLLSGTYVYDNGKDYIQANDGRRISLELCSSGQQEALPMAVTLCQVRSDPNQTFTVEEPEAHLFPSAQRDMMHLLSSTAGLSNRMGSTQYLITTHSPYILAALNNLMYGGKIIANSQAKFLSVHPLLSDTDVIAPELVTAYLMGNGTATSIIDRETSLIEAAVLDDVSGELAREFESLVEIDFEEKAA